MAVDQELDLLLYSAIEKKRLIQFKYKGKDRVAEPHDYGIQNGKVRLLCWQIGGHSGERIPGWRLIDVVHMQDYQLLERRFAGSRQVPSGKHHQWDTLFIRVEASEK